MYKLIDGINTSKIILKECEDYLKISNKKLNLSVIQIGGDIASTVYVNRKKKICEKLNIDFSFYKFDENANEIEIIDLIDKLNNDKNVTGIFLEMPIPKNFDKEKITSKISVYKDLDGISEVSIGRLVRNMDCLYPCTAYGVVELLNKMEIELLGKHCVILNRSDVIGKPLSHLLLRNDATVTICHSKTKNLKEITNMADILIVAVNSKLFIDKTFVREGVILIDCGIHVVDDERRIVGDVNFDDVKDRCSYITPVPGGVGAMTTAMLIKNLIKASEMYG